MATSALRKRQEMDVMDSDGSGVPTDGCEGNLMKWGLSSQDPSEERGGCRGVGYIGPRREDFHKNSEVLHLVRDIT